ncbi:Protein of unknown function [Actinopolymorpha cephalotaxi]|uniref:DUF402 domain-containing protein n=1 Tax=Actinopolymorpha cephalotaxi TaxID=504797 RepID=A0A1I2QQ69_9ACTN|nr:DUF402 domain-containing protein [Actinopolymorpha cephalotaxi]NYH82536.1 hypothetical protein [Actinopolymorpha cephalotaxi]SFG30745.1 Protein of unknown function [Actinopolymorpha cephalotaxi]
MRCTDRAFATGSTVVRRDVLRGKVWTATPFRVVSDTRDLLAVAIWPGVSRLAPTHQPALSSSRREEIVRDVALPNLVNGKWELTALTWQTHTKLTLVEPGTYFGVDLFFGAAGELVISYVNFQRPFRRTPIGVDTFDLLLDLVIEPDGTCLWKDELEDDQGRRLDIVTEDEHRHVQEAREQALALLDQRSWPFDERWHSWRRETRWELPTLPVNATAVPTEWSELGD